MTLRKTLTWLLAGAAFLILQACGSGGGAPVEQPVEEDDPIVVESTLPEGEVGEAGEEYEFTFVYNEEATQTSAFTTQASENEVVFRWAWGDGEADFATVSIQDGVAILTVEHTYAQDGPYGIVVSVEEPETAAGEPGEQLAELNYVVQIGEALEVEGLVLQCDGTESDVQRGSRGVHLHTWDLSSVPAGATIDLWYDTIGQPDKFILEYPVGTVVHDTGWRGHAFYGDIDTYPEFPGGIAGDPIETVEDVITKTTDQNELAITIIGPQVGTLWDYTLTCHQ